MVNQLMITAELRQWSLDIDTRTVKGIIHNPNPKSEFKEGEEYTIINYKNISQIPLFEENRGDYYLIQTQLGKYFRLHRSQMK